MARRVTAKCRFYDCGCQFEVCLCPSAVPSVNVNEPPFFLKDEANTILLNTRMLNNECNNCLEKALKTRDKCHIPLDLSGVRSDVLSEPLMPTIQLSTGIIVPVWYHLSAI